MAAPWEKYASTSPAEDDGPWAKYAGVPGMEKLGGTPPPAGLPPKVDMRQSMEPPDLTQDAAPLVGGPIALASKAAQMIPSGAGQAARGVEQIAGADKAPEGKGRAIAGGTSQIIRGVGTAAAPLTLPVAAATAPIATAAGLGVGTAASTGAEAGLKAAGVKPEYAALGGDVAGIAAGAGAAKLAPSAGPALKASGQRSYARALGPTTRENKLLTERQVAPGLIQRGVTAVTRKGLQAKIAASVEDLGQQVGDAIDALPPDAALPLNTIHQAIDSAGAKQFMVQSPNGPVLATPEAAQGMATLDQLKSVISAGATKDSQGNLVVDSRYLRELRQNWDSKIAEGKGFTTNDFVNNAKMAAYRAGTGAVRDEFAKAYPNVDAINKEYSLYRNAQKVIDATINRTQSQSKPLGRQLARAGMATAGMATGGPAKAALDAAAVDALMGAFQSSAWRTATAVMKDRLASAVMKGNSHQIQTLAGAIAGTSIRSQSGPPPLEVPEDQPPPLR